MLPYNGQKDGEQIELDGDRAYVTGGPGRGAVLVYGRPLGSQWMQLAWLGGLNTDTGSGAARFSVDQGRVAVLTSEGPTGEREIVLYDALWDVVHAEDASLYVEDVVSKPLLVGNELWLGSFASSGPIPILYTHGAVTRFTFEDLTERYCTQSLPGSGGYTDLEVVHGCSTLLANDLVLRGTSLPPHELALLIVGTEAASMIGAIGGAADLCVGGQIGRSTVRTISPAGMAQFPLDLHAVPGPNGPYATVAGSTIYAQVVHRDRNLPGGSHASPALAIEIR